MSSLAMTIRRLTSHEDDEYKAITISFDAEDSTDMAIQSKKTYLNLLDKNYPKEHWRFLTGDQATIDRLLDSIGANVIKINKHLFRHPNVLIVLADDGKIIRYIYGPNFLPFDVGMALTEAERGIPAISVKKVLSYCFAYDPKENTYVFQFFRVFGVAIPLLLFMFYFFFLRKGNQKQNRINS